MSLLGYINNGLNQSLNGIVTITDGNGTTISDGSVSSNSMTVSNFTATSLSANNLTITGTITLPNGSILDVYLTSNVCLLNATQTLNNKTLTNCGGITFPNSVGTKITYYTNYYTELQSSVLRTVVNSSGNKIFRVGSVDIVTINSSVLPCKGSLEVCSICNIK